MLYITTINSISINNPLWSIVVIQSSLSQQLTLGLARYNRSAGVRIAWDQTQKQFACCGVHNYTDWSMPPDSCCIHIIPGCGRVEQNLHISGTVKQCSCNLYWYYNAFNISVCRCCRSLTNLERVPCIFFSLYFMTS